MRRGSRERVRHRHETLWQRLGGTATTMNSPGVHGSAYSAPHGQHGHRAELWRSSVETVCNSASVAGSRHAGAAAPMCMAKRGYTARDEERPHTAGYLSTSNGFVPLAVGGRQRRRWACQIAFASATNGKMAGPFRKARRPSICPASESAGCRVYFRPTCDRQKKILVEAHREGPPGKHERRLTHDSEQARERHRPSLVSGTC